MALFNENVKKLILILQLQTKNGYVIQEQNAGNFLQYR